MKAPYSRGDTDWPRKWKSSIDAAAQERLAVHRIGGRSGARRQQAILGRGRWDANALPHILRDYELETLADDDAVLVVDETEFETERPGASRGNIQAAEGRLITVRGLRMALTDFGVERLIELIKVTTMTPHC